MLTRLEVRNYQSLTHIDLDLSGFTVIVGPSSSGKSAFVRALQTLTHNSRGSAFITQQQPGCTISATFTHGSVTLTRSRTSSGSDSYVVNSSTGQQRFTKLGGSVPPEVLQFLGQAADPSAVASQFDPVYLLSQSAAEAARTLSTVTGASILLEGAREANRRRLDAAQTLRTRTSDHATVTAELAQYTAHDAQTAAITRSGAVLERAYTVLHRLADLESLLNTLDYRAQGIRIGRQNLEALPAAPEISALQALADKISALGQLLDRVHQLSSSRHQLTRQLIDLDAQLAQGQHDQLEALRAAAVCPTCGQETAHLASAPTV